ncbi:MAG: hypothetical protein ACXVB1_15005 [Pseudobdellovibrionaceae bacterium]
MNNKLTAFLTTAIVTGLLASNTVKAEDTTASQGSGDQVTSEKNNCKGMSAGDKNSCKGMKDKKKKLKKAGKNSCKNGCGEAKEKKDETPKGE